MSFRVCIPTAGTGSRLGGMTKFVNKSLVSIANRPTISHLIEQFPADAEFVIALGHKGDLVREYLELAYPRRIFSFARVEPFEGPGSGLGLSLLACRQFLQSPFVFVSCDTLVKERIPAPDSNWMAYADVASLDPYRTLAVDKGRVTAICEKGEGRPGAHFAYIGLAGILDFGAFWEEMLAGGATSINQGEAYGLRALLGIGLSAEKYTWFDTGNPDALARSRAAFQEPGAPNILEKANEAIWFVDGNAVKFSDDRSFIANRVKRVDELHGYVPEVTASTPNMYRYPMAGGKVLSDAVNVPLFEKLLRHAAGFWKRKSLSGAEATAFTESCMRFYRDKTLERVQLFFRNFEKADGTEAINGRPMPTVAALLDSVDWDWLADGLPGRFHGDFHFENILWDAASGRFTFLDWRQDFGGDLSTGDIYYDLAKLLHGLIVCHELIAGNFFEVAWQADSIEFDLHRKQVLVECERRLAQWLAEEGYDGRRVAVLTALVYLNIAALHHYPYSLLLFALGKSMLKTELERTWT